MALAACGDVHAVPLSKNVAGNGLSYFVTGAVVQAELPYIAHCGHACLFELAGVRLID